MKETLLNAFSSFVKKESFDASSLNDDNVNEFLKLAFDQKITVMTNYSLLKSNNNLSQGERIKLKTLEYNKISVQVNKNQIFLSVYKQMTENGLKPICVKGLLLSLYYPSSDMRECSDEDLLVKTDEYEQCKEIILNNGFEFSSEGRNGYVQTFIHKKSRCMIDLHRTLFPNDDELYKSFNAYFNEVESIGFNFDGLKIFGLPATKQVIYLLLHSFKHFLYSGVGIRQIADLSLYAMNNEVDWNFIFTFCKDYQLTEFLSAVILIAEKYFGFDISVITTELFNKNVSVDNLLYDILNGGVYGTTDEDFIRANNLIYKEYLNSSNRKNKKLLNTLFPSKNQMKAKYYYVNKHPVLLPFSYINRIVDYIKSDSISKTMDISNERKELLRQYGILK